MSNIEHSEGRKQHPRRVKRLGDHKRRTGAMAAYIADTIAGRRGDKLAQELTDCHNWLLFRDYYEAGTVRLHRTISCRKHLLCPLCAILRAARSVRKYHEKYEAIRQATPGLRLYYVVLTVKNGVDLKERFAHMEKAVRMLVERRRQALKAMQGSRKHAHALGSAFAHVAGGAYSFEVKRGAGSGEWHPHANVLLLLEGPIDARALSEEWEGITGDSYVVHCEEKPVDDKTVFVEIFKYALKFSEMTCADTYHAYETLQRRKLLGTFGAFRGVKVPEGDDEIVDSPFVELVYRYTAGGYRSAPEKAQVFVGSGGLVIQEGQGYGATAVRAGGGGEREEVPELVLDRVVVPRPGGKGWWRDLSRFAHLKNEVGASVVALAGWFCSSLSPPVPGGCSRSG